jgi:hypothetical protein
MLEVEAVPQSCIPSVQNEWKRIGRSEGDKSAEKKGYGRKKLSRKTLKVLDIMSRRLADGHSAKDTWCNVRVRTGTERYCY